jgi:Uma2 family endonuclease
VEQAVLVTRAPSEALLAERRRLGLDRHDEIWAGEHHMMTPGPSGPHARLAFRLAIALDAAAGRVGLIGQTESNVGQPDDFRVPDLCFVRSPTTTTYAETAALVVEVVSPGDDSWKKFDFYAARGVDEVLIADPHEQALHWFRLVGDGYEPTDRSDVLDLLVADVHAAIDWSSLR